MDQQERQRLRRLMAVEAFVVEGAEMRVPAAESRAVALRIASASDEAVTTAEQGAKQIQHWRSLEHQMGLALTALEKLGYTCIPKS